MRQLMTFLVQFLGGINAVLGVFQIAESEDQAA